MEDQGDLTTDRNGKGISELSFEGKVAFIEPISKIRKDRSMKKNKMDLRKTK